MSWAWILYTLSAFVLCVVLAGILIPRVFVFSVRKRLFDIPDKRKVHHGLVPRLGGIIFLPVAVLSLVLLLAVSIVSGQEELPAAVRIEEKQLVYTGLALAIAYIAGIMDDLKGIRYDAKLLVQICCGILMVMGGVFLSDLHGLLWIHSIPVWLAFPLSVFAVVFIVNAINLIDGIDGLASGLCLLAFLCYSVTFITLRLYVYAMLSLAMVGTLVCFYHYNVYGCTKPDRKIFMGDTGSMTLGIMISFFSIQIANTPDMVLSNANPLVGAFSPLLVPCLDMVRVFLTRVYRGTNPCLPDRIHIHHLLMDRGMGQHKAMALIVSLSVVLTLFNILLSHVVNPTLLLCADITIYIIMLCIIIEAKKYKNVS